MQNDVEVGCHVVNVSDQAYECWRYLKPEGTRLLQGNASRLAVAFNLVGEQRVELSGTRLELLRQIDRGDS